MSTYKIDPNKEKAKQKVSKDELSDKDTEKVTGGSEFTIKKTTDSASPDFFKN